MTTRTKVAYTTNLYLETCCSCGVPFGLSQEIYDRRQEDGETFYCPNGHSQHYTQKASLEEDLKNAQARLAKQREVSEWYEEQLKNTTNSLRATKAAHTRTKNRIKNGVCPCCNRSFENLHRHMKTQHPEYEGSES